MIEHRIGDLLKQDDIEVIIHQCNCFCNMGKGIAVQIKNSYPEAYEADYKTLAGDVSKMGTYSVASIDNGKKMIVNLYSQYNYGLKLHNSQSKFTEYDAMQKALEKFVEDYESSFVITGKPLVVGIPFKIGCDLGGGDWNIVLKIFEDLFENNEKFKLVIVKLPK